MNAEKIKEQIKNEDEYTVGALIALYKQQTPDEQSLDTTAHDNAAGFNAFDAPILSDISKYYLEKGKLSDKQIRLVRTKLVKYCEQLARIGVQPLSLEKAETQQKKKRRKVKRAVKESDTLIRVEFTFSNEVLDQVKGIQGRKFIADGKYWTVPLTITNVDKLLEFGFQLDKELSDWYDGQVNGITDSIDIPGLNDILRPFQKYAVSFIDARNGRALIADEMGLGKTVEAIAWMQLHGSSVYPVVIVCPATLKLTWLGEINKFTDLGDDVEIIEGKTPYALTKPIAIINYDILWDWVGYFDDEFKPKLVIADEIHYCKSRGFGFKTIKGKKKKTVITKRSASLEILAKHTQYFIGLTGTPILNRPIEIYNPLKMIKPTLFPNFRQFAYRYCAPSFNGFATEYKGASNTIELNQILTKEVMLRRKKEDVLKELPPKTRALVPLEIDNMQEYRRAEKELIEYLHEIDPEKAKRAKRAKTLAQINTLRSLAVRGKMKQVSDWISDFIENDKLVVFAHHHETIDLLMDRFKSVAVKLDGRESKANRKEKEDKFQNDESVRLFIGQIQAAGVGITLTAASNVAFVEYPWSPGIYVQAEDRCHRISQEDNVTVWNLIAENTIERSIAVLLEEKARTVSSIIDGDVSEDSGIFNDLLDNLAA